MFSALILHSFNLGAAHKPFHVRENVPGVFHMEISQCTYVSISIYTSYFCFAVCIIANICVCLCVRTCVCVSFCVSMFFFVRFRQWRMSVLRREKKQRRGGSQRLQVNNLQWLQQLSDFLPSSFTFQPALKQTYTVIVLPSYWRTRPANFRALHLRSAFCAQIDNWIDYRHVIN